MRKRHILALLAFMIAGCVSSPPNPAGVALGEQFQLAYGQSVDIREAGFGIEFVAVVEDSRCAEGAVCVWEGNARVEISVSNIDASLNTTLEPRQVSHQGYLIRLLAVNPYPVLGEQIEPEDYVIALIVTKE
ncbi:MAG: hypothetical protein PVJ32_00800 [Anaerolineales bacterium]